METMVAFRDYFDAAWRICYDPCFKRRRYFVCGMLSTAKQQKEKGVTLQ